MLLIKTPKLITLNVLYYRPDFCHLLQEFLWQFEDVTPDLPRVHKFLTFWKENIPAVISEVSICESSQMGWRRIDAIF